MKEKIKMNNNFTLENFNKNGVAYPFELSKKFEKNKLLQEYLNYKKMSEKFFGTMHSLKPHLLSTFFNNIAKDDSIVNKIKKIIGEDIYIWSSAFFAKAPGEGKIVSYHQDNPYWQLTTDKVVSAWVALTDSNLKSGALEVVPQSHKMGIINKLDVKNARTSYLKGERTTKPNDLLSYNQDLDGFIKKNPPTVLDLKPNQFSLHHVNAVHGSGINKTENYRVGFAIRYISSDTKHTEEKSDLALHISGKTNDYYQNEEGPKQDFDHKAIKQYQLSMNSTGVFGNKKY